MIVEGVSAPDFTLPDQDGQDRTLSLERDRWIVLYFYPKDDTPGCTTEACQFRDALPRLAASGVTVWGVSADTVAKHKKFEQKHGLSFPLLADVDKTVVQAYGVWGEKKFMGKTYLGITRATVVVDPRGIVAKVYPKVSPDGHAGMVLADIQALQAGV